MQNFKTKLKVVRVFAEPAEHFRSNAISITTQDVLLHHVISPVVSPLRNDMDAPREGSPGEISSEALHLKEKDKWGLQGFLHSPSVTELDSYCKTWH